MADPEDTPGSRRPPEPAGSQPPLDSDPAVPGAATAARPRKRRWLRRTLWTGGVLVLLLIVLLALLPTLLSTAPGTSLVEKIANGQVDGTVRIEGLSLGWFSGMRVREVEVRDSRDTQVLVLANLQSGLTVGEALRSDFDLGETTGRLNLTVVRVYDDGTTNLHEVFRIEPSVDDEPWQFPDIRGRIRLDGHAGVQYVGKRDDPSDDAAPVDVDFDGTEFVLAPGQPLEHNIPLALRVNGNPSGTILAKGTIDLNTLSAERPTIQEDVQLTDLQLSALGTLLAPFGLSDYELAGVLNGSLKADIASDAVRGQFAATEVRVDRRDAAGEGYASDRVELDIDGRFITQELPPDQHVTLEDGTKITARQLVGIQRLVLTTPEDGTLTGSGKVDLLVLQTGALANWPMLKRDLTLDIKTTYATAHGEGENLGAFSFEATVDLARMNERFGNLLAAGGARPTEGRAHLTLKTQPGTEPGSVTVPLNLSIEDLVLVQTQAEAAPAPPRRPGVLSADPPAAQATQAPPLRLGLVRLDATATIPPARDNAPIALSQLGADLVVADADRQPIITAKLAASDIDAASTGGRIVLDNLSLPDYARLRATLAGWVDLPEPHEPVEPVTMTAAARYDGASGALELAEPLIMLLGAEELANVTAKANRQEDGAWVIPLLTANISVPVADGFASKFGSKVATRDPAAGQVSLRVVEGQPIRVNPADVAGTLQGAIELAMRDAEARGMSLSGSIPVALTGASAAVPADAPPLAVNGGELRLGGASLAQQGESWHLRLPQGKVLKNVSLNPVAMEFFGKYINPVFVEPEQAGGFLDVELIAADTIDLADPLGTGNISLAFSIRELRVDNDIIAQFAEASVGESAGAIRAQLANIPGVDQQIRQRIAGMSLSKEIKGQISSIRGNISGARVSLKGGVADTQITFNVADPRTSATQPGGRELYPLSFTGGVDTKTLATRNLSVTVPVSLIEKWVGENPQDLVDLFGERPWPKLLPQGVKIGINGTTYLPAPDPRSFQAMAREVAPRAAEAAVRGKLEDALRRLRGE